MAIMSSSSSPTEKTLIAVQKRPNRFVMFVKNNFLLISILVSIVIGFGVGLGLRAGLDSSESAKVVRWFTLPGKLFIRALELLVVPVIFVGVTAATSSLSPKNNLRITLICVGLVLLTHVAATLVGLAGSLILVAIPSAQKPVNNATITAAIPEKQKDTYDIIADILYNLIPKNIIRSTTSQEITKYYGQLDSSGNVSYSRKTEYVDGSNILGILTFSILIGLASSVLEDKAKLFREFFKSCNDVVILALRWLIMFAPIGIASLIIDAVFEVEDLAESFKQIGVFAGLCVAALLFYGVLVLALIIFVLTRKNPFRYYYYFLEPALLAFASTSGAVCIQKSLEICDQKVKMDPRLSKFTIPFYTALQADGSAIFITMSCAFIANYSGISLSAGDYAVIVIMTTILCLCLPSVPSSSIVTILVVLNAVNVDPSNIAILYTFEWLLDRVRTAVNLYSHCFCAVITYELNKGKLDNLQFDLPADSENYNGREQSSLPSNQQDQTIPMNELSKNQHQRVNSAFVEVAPAATTTTNTTNEIQA